MKKLFCMVLLLMSIANVSFAQETEITLFDKLTSEDRLLDTMTMVSPATMPSDDQEITDPAARTIEKEKGGEAHVETLSHQMENTLLGEESEDYDPWQSFNETMFGFNRQFDHFL